MTPFEDLLRAVVREAVGKILPKMFGPGLRHERRAGTGQRKRRRMPRPISPPPKKGTR